MFPLGTVLFPHGVLPLQIFESRYLTMVDHSMRDDATFAVCLIERGNEVGGGDERHDVGTLAKIVRAGKIDENRLMIVAVGVERIKVLEWLMDDPYPIAITEPFPEPASAVDLSTRIDHTARTWRRLMALATELGADMGSIDIDLPSDPEAAVWMLCATAPLEQLDRQRLLELDTSVQRLDALEIALEDKIELMEARL